MLKLVERGDIEGDININIKGRYKAQMGILKLFDNGDIDWDIPIYRRDVKIS